jgi:uncharacterized protein YcnI
MSRAWLVPPLAIALALVLSAAAFAHPSVSPAVVELGATQTFALAVPTEKEGVTTTQVELLPPAGFEIEAFVPVAGWERTAERAGTGETARVSKVVWTGGKTPAGEATVFQIVGTAAEAKTYAFGVRQTYSDGTVVSWTGGAGSETQAARLEAQTTLGGGGGTLAVVAFVIATAALVAGAIALLLQVGNRDLA